MTKKNNLEEIKKKYQKCVKDGGCDEKKVVEYLEQLNGFVGKELAQKNSDYSYIMALISFMKDLADNLSVSKSISKWTATILSQVSEFFRGYKWNDAREQKEELKALQVFMKKIVKLAEKFHKTGAIDKNKGMLCVDLLWNLYISYYYLQDFQGAQLLFDKVESFLDKYFLDGSLLEQESYVGKMNEIARVYSNYIEDPVSAVRTYKKVLVVVEKLYAKDSKGWRGVYTTTLSNLATDLQRLDKSKEAEKYYLKLFNEIDDILKTKCTLSDKNELSVLYYFSFMMYSQNVYPSLPKTAKRKEFLSKVHGNMKKYAKYIGKDIDLGYL